MVTDHKNDEKPGRENHKSYHLGLLRKIMKGIRIYPKLSRMPMSMGFTIGPERIWRPWQNMPRV